MQGPGPARLSLPLSVALRRWLSLGPHLYAARREGISGIASASGPLRDRSARTAAELGGYVLYGQLTGQTFQFGNIVLRPSTFKHTQRSYKKN